MRTASFDFATLWRSTIGFDRLFDLADAAQRLTDEDHYPPYNIEHLGDDRYQISLAVAGRAFWTFKIVSPTVTSKDYVFTTDTPMPYHAACEKAREVAAARRSYQIVLLPGG